MVNYRRSRKFHQSWEINEIYFEWKHWLWCQNIIEDKCLFGIKPLSQNKNVHVFSCGMKFALIRLVEFSKYSTCHILISIFCSCSYETYGHSLSWKAIPLFRLRKGFQTAYSIEKSYVYPQKKGGCKFFFIILYSRMNNELFQLPPWLSSRKCTICDRFFANNKSLQKHIQCVHEKLKPYICNVCEYRTSRKAMLEVQTFLRFN